MGKVSVHDVAAYILKQVGKMTAMKLEKIVFYCQVWSLVWDERPLFREAVEAWANGPVVPQLYERHRGKFNVEKWDGNPDILSPQARETIDAVLNHYGKMTAQQLSDLTHNEPPWAMARKGLAPDDRSRRTITHEAMNEYYSSIPDRG